LSAVNAPKVTHLENPRSVTQVISPLESPVPADPVRRNNFSVPFKVDVTGKNFWRELVAAILRFEA
jgi:hypothetical protein